MSQRQRRSEADLTVLVPPTTRSLLGTAYGTRKGEYQAERVSFSNNEPAVGRLGNGFCHCDTQPIRVYLTARSNTHGYLQRLSDLGKGFPSGTDRGIFETNSDASL